MVFGSEHFEALQNSQDRLAEAVADPAPGVGFGAALGWNWLILGCDEAESVASPGDFGFMII